MKKLFLIAVAGCFFVLHTEAQVHRDVARSQKVRSDSSRHAARGSMINDLNLTQDQKSQMKALHETSKQQREAIKNDASLTADQKKAKMKDLQQSQSDKMNGILTPDQQAKRKAYIEKRKDDRKIRGKKGFHRTGKDTDDKGAQGTSGI